RARDEDAMGFLEWHQALGVLDESPRWVADRLRDASPASLTRAPGEGRWSVIEVIAHVLAGDRDVFLPRLDLFEREVMPRIEYVDLSGRESDPAVVGGGLGPLMEAWSRLRADLVARLATLGPGDWSRFALHSNR